MTPGGPLSTNEYYKYLLGYAKKLEAAVEDNTPRWKANSSEADYLRPYSPPDPCYSKATDLSAYMLDRGHDVDAILEVFHYHQAIKQGRPRPPPRTRREPIRDELKILNPTWSGLQGDTKRAWSNETNENKEKIIVQFVANSKSSSPVTKNHHICVQYTNWSLKTETVMDIILIGQQILKVHINSISTLPCLILLPMIVMGRVL